MRTVGRCRELFPSDFVIWLTEYIVFPLDHKVLVSSLWLDLKCHCTEAEYNLMQRILLSIIRVALNGEATQSLIVIFVSNQFFVNNWTSSHSPVVHSHKKE